MRTTLDLDEDVLQAARELATQRSTTMGRVLSDLARRALTPARSRSRTRNGVPLLDPRPGAGVVTRETVNGLRDEP